MSNKKLTTMKKNIDISQEKLKHNSKHSTRKIQKNDIESDAVGICYPLDLWFLISEYIHPESVGKFASICRSSYQVVKTGKFWFHLYRRYYKPIPNLPERLKPECMVRLHGLRACVIRTLHFTYFSTLNNIHNSLYFDQTEPHSLVSRKCTLMWHKKGVNRWYFFFKFKKTEKSYKKIEFENYRKKDPLDILEDVFENTEEDCRVLRVACSEYQMVPLANGLVLQYLKIALSRGLVHYQLHLNFGNTYMPKISTQKLVLSKVVDCKVLDWWHPYYPHQDTVSDPLPLMQSWES